jgi:hypothetical protein
MRKMSSPQGNHNTGPSFDEIHATDLGNALNNLECGSVADQPHWRATVVDSDVQIGPASGNLPHSSLQVSCIQDTARAWTHTPSGFDAAQQAPLDPSTFTPSSTSAGKRKATEEDDIVLRATLIHWHPPDSSKSGASGKSARLSMLVVIQQMRTEVHGLNSTFGCATNAIVAGTSNSVSARRHKAVVQLEKENLDDNQLLTIVTKFQSDIGLVDVYLTMSKESLRKKFLDMHSK